MILTEKIPFILDDVYICPWVDLESGVQKILLTFEENGQLVLQDEIDCIHSAMYSKTIIEDGNKSEPEIELKSTELEKIEIDAENKYFYLKSWAQALSEVGDDAIKLQESIENMGNFQYPISSRLLMFLSHVNIDYMLNYIHKINDEAIFEEKRHLPSFKAGIGGILQMIIYSIEERLHHFRGDYKIDADRILNEIFLLDPPLELFTDEFEFIQFLENPNAVNMSEFDKTFDHEDPGVRMACVKNPAALKLPKYRRFLSPYMEKNGEIRKIAAEKMNLNN